MHRSIVSRLVPVLIPVGLVVGYIGVMGGTRSCPMCTGIVDSTLKIAHIRTVSDAGPAAEKDGPGEKTDQKPDEKAAGKKPGTTSADAGPDAGGFKLQRRPGSVDLKKAYDLSDPQIPIDEIHTLLPRDAIPALVDPKEEPAAGASWLDDTARVIEVSVGGEAVAVPMAILNWHEIANLTVAGEPVAATYCPLCDSATVFSRRLKQENGETVTLEFGVSGALYNSNVLMYDRTDKGLWSQVLMKAVTGPNAGRSLTMMPIRVVTFGSFKKAHPGGRVVSRETGYARDYDPKHQPYAWYFKTDRTLVDVRGVGGAMPGKTLGVGIEARGRAWFVPQSRLESGPVTVSTPLGDVVVSRTDAGVSVDRAPEGVHTAQSFYFDWSAFYPHTEILGEG